MSWQKYNLSEFCKTGSGSTPSRSKSRDYYGGNIPWVKSGELKEFEISDTEETVTEKALKETAIKMVPKGALLIAMYGATVGRMAFLGKAATTNQAVCHIIPDPAVCDSRYLFYSLQNMIPQLLDKRVGGGQPNISQQIVKDLEIPLPPLEEQKRIAAILDKADAICRKRQAAIKLADDFLRATFLDMFGDPVTNPNGLVIRPIAELLADIPNAARTGPFGSQLKHSEFTDEGIPVLGIDNVVTNEFRWKSLRCLPPEKYEQFKRYRVFPDDLIITIMGTTGRVAVAPSDLPECMSTKHLCVLTMNKDKLDPFFLWATLLFDNKARNQAKSSSCGAIMEGWNMGIIKKIDIRVPPINMQRTFRTIFEKSKRLKEKQTALAENSANLLFNSLTQRAFRGDL